MGDVSVALSMTIRERPQDDSSAAQNAIRELVKNKTLRFVDMTLTMVRNGQLSELKDVGTVLRSSSLRHQPQRYRGALSRGR